MLALCYYDEKSYPDNLCSHGGALGGLRLQPFVSG